MPEPTPDARYTDAEKFLYGGQWYENSELARLPEQLGGVRVFIDVGASLGPYTLCADQALKDADIYAIEANPQTFKRLSELCAESKSTNRLHPVHTAVSSEAGQIDFFIPTIKSSRLPLTSSLFQNQAVTDDWEKVSVACVTLDEFCKDLAPDFIKMDIEGAEYRALLGAERILREGRCRFLVEVHPWGDPDLGKRPEDVFKLFHSHGYDFRRLARHWLFTKSPGGGLLRWVKLQAITLIMRCLPLKQLLKKIVLWRDARRG